MDKGLGQSLWWTGRGPKRFAAKTGFENRTGSNHIGFELDDGDNLRNRWEMGKRLCQERDLLDHSNRMQFLERVSTELGEWYSVQELGARMCS